MSYGAAQDSETTKRIGESGWVLVVPRQAALDRGSFAWRRADEVRNPAMIFRKCPPAKFLGFGWNEDAMNARRFEHHLEFFNALRNFRGSAAKVSSGRRTERAKSVLRRLLKRSRSVR